MPIFEIRLHLILNCSAGSIALLLDFFRRFDFKSWAIFPKLHLFPSSSERVEIH